MLYRPQILRFAQNDTTYIVIARSEAKNLKTKQRHSEPPTGGVESASEASLLSTWGLASLADYLARKMPPPLPAVATVGARSMIVR